MFSRAINNKPIFLLLIILFGEKNLFVYSKRCDTSNGAFINLCGRCVDKATISDSEDLNNSGVCMGSRDCAGDENNCKNCDAIKCAPYFSVSPQKIDLASVSETVELVPYGSSIGLNQTNFQEATCSLISRNENIDDVTTTTPMHAGKIKIEFNSNDLKLGVYDLRCKFNSTEAIESNSSIEVVNSELLKIESVSPKYFPADVYVQPVLQLENFLDNKTDLLCILKIKNKTNVIVKALNLSGNEVQCSPMRTSASNVFVGLAETLEAALDRKCKLKTVEVPVVSLGPIMKKASFSSDLRQLSIYFDQNINDSGQCERAFTPETVSLFGKDWSCWLQANELTVQLGVNPSVRPGSRLQLSRNNGIRRKYSEPSTAHKAQDTVVIVEDVTNEVIGPRYRLSASSATCNRPRSLRLQSSAPKNNLRLGRGSRLNDDRDSVTTVEVQELGGQTLRYNWSVSYNLPQNGKSQSQREMLLLWLSIRSLEKNLKKVTTNQVQISNSLLLPGVEYKFIVRGINALGMAGEEKLIPVRLPEKVNEMPNSRFSRMMVTGCEFGNPLKVTLSGLPAVFPDAENWIETSVSCCNDEVVADVLSQINYSWTVVGKDGKMVDVSSQHGKRLLLSPGLLHGGQHYNVSCLLKYGRGNSTVASDFMVLEALERGIKTVVNVSAVAISTAHPLVLDASSSNDLDNKPGKLQFQWSCRCLDDESGLVDYGGPQCFVPGPNRQLISEVYKSYMNQSILRLPPGALSMGRYQFSVRAFKNTVSPWTNDLTIVNVQIVGGTPPLIYFPIPNSTTKALSNVINPEDGFTINGHAAGLKVGCRISWSTVDLPGYLSIDDNSVSRFDYVALANEKDDHEFLFDLSPKLIGNAKYRLRLSAICPSGNAPILFNSYADVDILTDAPPVVQPLEVAPTEGEALLTEFKFSTKPSYDDLLDFPLSYSFGYRPFEPENDFTTLAKFFHTSNQNTNIVTVLPAFSLTNVTKLASVLKVCDARHICHSVEGPILSTFAPRHLTTQHVEALNKEFALAVVAEEYENAVILLESNIRTLSILDDKSLYSLASRGVETTILNQLEILENKLNTSSGSLHSALNFLEAANSALKFSTFSQETLQRLVSFKDVILHMISSPVESENPRKKRDVSYNKSHSTNKNVLNRDVVETLLGISEVAILNLNDSRRALTEKMKLLQNVSYFMEYLCDDLQASIPLFVGSKVVSFSVQKLNMEVKYKDELAVPDWRSAKSGGAPVNATALVQLGYDVSQAFEAQSVCMGGAIYPLDILSDVSSTFISGSIRSSAVYHVKIIPRKSKYSTPNRSWGLDALDGIDIGSKTIKVKIPIWEQDIGSSRHLECLVWNHNTWTSQACTLVKVATIINKPAVECACSILGYYAIFAIENTATGTFSTSHPVIQSSTASTLSTSAFNSTSSSTSQGTPISQDQTEITTSRSQSSPEVQSTRSEQFETTVQAAVTDMLMQESTSANSIDIRGLPISNTTKNYTFRIDEDFSSTVGSHQESFKTQLKNALIQQFEMPANMIHSIDVDPGSILVTLHLVDTDVRSVDDVVPALTAALQDGRLTVNGVDGRSLSVPPQSLQLLEFHSESLVEENLLPWIATGCTAFSLLCLSAVVTAAVIVKRKQQELQFSSDPASPEMESKVPVYGRFYLEHTLDGTEATLSRYRSTTANPLVVSTIGGLASVMGTNATSRNLDNFSSVRYKLQSPLSETRD